METSKVYNILLLGETGVGKSTFINTLLNYISYENLSDIIHLKHLIGVNFTLVDKNFTEKTISIAEDDNESNQRGKSSTKRPKTHKIELSDGSVLNIIDTPGLGDTQGIENDYKNVEKILEYISELENLNAICIMLKPNNSRLSVVFEYCIKTVLGHLDQDVRKNVVFIFSNGRSSFYTPGDTQLPLEKLLNQVDSERINPIPFQKSNTFCVESDWFRYLAAKQNGFKFSPEEVSIFEDNWKKSSSEVKRMINYIKSLPPRRLKGIITINEAKRLIRKLTSTIVNVLALEKKKMKQLQSTKGNLEAALSNKKVLEDNLEVDRKRTATQTSYVNVDQKTTKNKYGHNIGILPISGRIEFGTNTDSEFYDQKQEETVLIDEKVQDPYVKAQLEVNEKDVKEVQEELDSIQSEIKEIKNEFNTLLTASAQFNAFLKENVPFYSMDQVEASFEEMKKESEKIDKDEFKMYKNILKNYKSKKESIHSVDMVEVHKTIANLLKLKHSGPELSQKLNEKVIQ